METILMLARSVMVKIDSLPAEFVSRMSIEQRRAKDKYFKAAVVVSRDYEDDVMPRFVYNAALKQLSACSTILDATYRELELKQT